MRDDPFAKLGALDQQLFRPKTEQPSAKKFNSEHPEQPPTLQEEQPPKQGTLEARNQGTQPAGKQPNEESTKVPGNQGGEQPVRPPLDLDMRPDRQNTYAFTADELEKLEDLKIAITRQHDLAVTKNDLIRLALHLLLEDYQQHADQSVILERLRNRRRR